jgi:hypothetical protein
MITRQLLVRYKITFKKIFQSLVSAALTREPILYQ